MSPEQIAAMDEEALDGEGVWAPEIEQAFQEALVEFPACGRRKHIIQEENGGRMYGRNELIAKYIFRKTGKERTRKQVSSHIQVLARRRAKMDNSLAGSDNGSNGTPSPAGPRSLSASSTSLSASHQSLQPFAAGHPQHNHLSHLTSTATSQHTHCPHARSLGLERRPSPAQHAINTKRDELDLWLDRPVANQRIRLVEFAAFVERPATRSPHEQTYWTQLPNPLDPHARHNPCHTHPGQASATAERHDYVRLDYTRVAGGPAKLECIAVSEVQDKFPELGGPSGLCQRCPSDSIYLIKFWADINHDLERLLDDDQNSYFGFSSHFETVKPMGELTCSTRACSYGQQVVEKVDRIQPSYNLANGFCSYAVDRSPMCEFMIQFIKKLRQLPTMSLMNNVLENFTILQVITNEATGEVLLCLALAFEINSAGQSDGPQHNVYKLTKN